MSQMIELCPHSYVPEKDTSLESLLRGSGFTEIVFCQKCDKEWHRSGNDWVQYRLGTFGSSEKVITDKGD